MYVLDATSKELGEFVTRSKYEAQETRHVASLLVDVSSRISILIDKKDIDDGWFDEVIYIGNELERIKGRFRSSWVLPNIFDKSESNIRSDSIVTVIIRALRTVARARQNGGPAKTSSLRDELLKNTPVQKIGPAQFGITDGVLKIVPQDPVPMEGAELAANQAREVLLEVGAKLRAELERSNCDPRLASAVDSLHASLSTGRDIIRTGLLAVSLENMRAAYAHELHDAVSAMMMGYSHGLNLYVGQHYEWRKFVENAALADLDDNDIPDLKRMATELSTILETRDNVDPEVPKTLLVLSDAISGPKKAMRRAAFGIVRTVENLTSAILRWSANLVVDTGVQTSSLLAKGGSRAIAIGLLGAALHAIIGIEPIAAGVGAAWLIHAKKTAEKIKELIVSDDEKG
ncbi:hypothetical protein [Sphingomonas caeni]|uniref:hypothetical protein n=1 Tax=Sphingomonas caeni TaxID=2984949 RepID=UPI00222E1A2E|nr:hypothetical protein [Sphingomonas caeni]